MGINIEQDQQIDRYIKGQMSVSEIAEFETLIANDSELSEEVELQTAIAKAIYKKNMLNVVNGNKNKVIKHTFTRKTIVQITSLAAAACFAGILLFSHFYQLHTYNQLSDNYYTAYQSVYDMPSRGEALIMNSSDSLLINSITLIKNGNSEKAVAQLTTIITKPNALQYIEIDVAQWYLALAQLKEGNKKEAVKLIEQLKLNKESEFALKAENLLGELE